MYPAYRILTPLALSAALVACGGGSGDSTPNPTPIPIKSSSSLAANSSTPDISSVISTSISSARSASVNNMSASSSSSSVAANSSATNISSTSELSSNASSVPASSASVAPESSSSSSSVDSPIELHSLVDFPVGVAVSAGYETRSFLAMPEKQATIKQHFNQLTAGNIMKMSYLQPSEDNFTFDNADALVNWAKANGLNVHGHALVWHSDYQIPDFMKNYTGDFETALNTHVSTVADHFKGDVVSWDVVNEAIDETQANCYRNSLFYQQLGTDYIANAFTAARAADPDADLYYNDYSTEGGNQTKFECLVNLVEGLLDNNVPIDGVGFQMHVQIDWPSSTVIEAAFKTIADLGLKVKVTELDVPVNNPYASTPFPQYSSNTDDAQQAQKLRYKAIAKAYLDAVPAAQRGGFTVWGLVDQDSWIRSFDSYTSQQATDWPLLFTGPADGPYEAKPALDGLIEAFTN